MPPNGSYFHIGPGTEFFNVYPLFHTEAFYDGMRKDMNERALILARDSYLGAQRNGTIFWSSDISGNWDTLKRQVPTGHQLRRVGHAVLEHGYRRLAGAARGTTSRSGRC